ncbi:MAG: 3D domain-containing protein [Armatimonadota bacterium]|nr:3D domain-containing protein [Armatimonadota bacterium]MDR7480324.1 3D domain-containing protein [Armatimonadota bacterium]MDR7489391.1 3D domain-containing protein [Armatimonadota bacterium]MDR7491369.1 3D domain-containing protein [Armatimonadota bacterium]MDR7502135.1 3D domain-containing protein [Armatimonadota bacterium]
MKPALVLTVAATFVGSAMGVTASAWRSSLPASSSSGAAIRRPATPARAPEESGRPARPTGLESERDAGAPAVPITPRRALPPVHATLDLDSWLSEGDAVEVRRPAYVSVVADGRARPLLTTAATVAQALREAGVRVGKGDRVFPHPSSLLQPQSRIRVIRIRREVLTRQVAIPPATVRRRDPTVNWGRVVTEPGRAGVRQVTVVKTYADGRLVSVVQTAARLLRPAVPTVVRVGQRRLVASRGAFAGYEYLDVVATAYAPWHGKGVDGTTAIGLRAGYGVVAVDPRVIPLRSRLYIEGYGYAIAGDTGGRIKGLRVDLGFDSVREARRFGRRPVRVYILQRYERR